MNGPFGPAGDEEAERERLREEAAQAVGLTSSLVISAEQHSQPVTIIGNPDADVLVVTGGGTPNDQDDAEVH